MTIALFAVLCVAAVVVSHFAHDGRDCVVFASRVLLVNWLLFASYWIYAPLSPAFMAYGAGQAMGLDLPVKHEDMWAIADLASMIAVAVRCRHVWWGPMLWSVYMVTLCMHAVAWANGLEYLEYKAVLDASLVMQLAILFMLGGGGCADYLSAVWRRFRRVGVGARRNAEASS